jgi:hypothetical protein
MKNHAIAIIFSLLFYVLPGFACEAIYPVSNNTLINLCTQGSWDTLNKILVYDRLPKSIDKNALKICINESLVLRQISICG